MGNFFRGVRRVFPERVLLGSSFFVRGMSGLVPILCRCFFFFLGFFGSVSGCLSNSDGAPLFGREREVLGLPRENRLRVDARRFARKERRDDDAGVLSVEERDAPALIASRVLERIEPDNAHLVNAHRGEAPNLLGYIVELLDFRVERADFLVMPEDNRLEVGAVFPFEKHLLALLELMRFSEKAHGESQIEEEEKRNSPRYSPDGGGIGQELGAIHSS